MSGFRASPPLWPYIMPCMHHVVRATTMDATIQHTHEAEEVCTNHYLVVDVIYGMD